MVDMTDLKSVEHLLVWVRLPSLVRLENGLVAQLVRAKHS